MADSKNRLQAIGFSGIRNIRFEDSNAVFIDPVRVLNRSYTRFKLSPSAYYTRSFESKPAGQDPRVCSTSRKRKRKEKKKKPQALNEREQIAQQRHQEVRPLLVKAHECLEVMSNLRSESGISESSPGFTQPLVELGRVWQAPMYEIGLHFHSHDNAGEGSRVMRCPAFNTLVVNETSEDVEAELVNFRYILPPETSFYMSDLGQIHNLIPADSHCGYNLIVVDPPWENGSACQKLREKLRVLVEKELFPAWGVKYVATFFWLKVKPGGSLICDLDLFHHRPYECLLLGLCPGKDTNSKHLIRSTPIPDNQVILSIPGDYSRKPPIAALLKEYAPRLQNGKCIELFAREMAAGWVSWGNEPLQFQESRNFSPQ